VTRWSVSPGGHDKIGVPERQGIGSTDVSTYTGKWRRDGEQLLLLCGLLNGYDFCDPDSPPTKTGTLKGGRYVVKIWPELLGPEVWVKQ